MAANEEDEPTVSLVDVLQDDDDLENEAYAIFGDGDPEECSYPKGYVKRQALFACKTCTPRGAEPAGVCLACSDKCHEGHDLFELYTKRNFRCDCGNGKFPEFQCKLYPEKDRFNTNNKYNHNFFGLYCICERPCPDPEDLVPDEMIQCISCEDWFHAKHLGCAQTECVELQEMVCESCMNKAPFLWTYAAHLAAPPAAKLSPCKEDVKVNVEDDEDDVKREEAKKLDLSRNREEPTASTCCGEEDQMTTAAKVVLGCKRTHQEREDRLSKRLAPGPNCKLKELRAQGPVRAREGAVFWPYVWRSKLCTCISCKRGYVEVGVPFLMDESDTILAFENKGRLAQEGNDPLMSVLNRLDHVQQLEIIYEYNDMKAELKEFLQRLAEEGKVVTPEDVQRFFQDLQTRKKQRTAQSLNCS